MSGTQEAFFGQLAIQKGYITLEQLDECLRTQKRMHPPRRIGEILLDSGYITAEQVDDILIVQGKQKSKEEVIHDMDDDKLEKQLVAKGFITPRNLKEAKRIQEMMKQKGKQMNLAEILLAKRFVTMPQLRRLQKDASAEEFPVIEGYEIIEKMNKGGMGTVYKARQISMDRVIGLKVLSPELADDDTYVKRFIIEAKAVAKLNHVNIVSGFDAGQSNGYYFFAMEFIEGETILDIMRREKILSVPFALTVAYQTALALEHAAKHNITHRDIKPGNIMVTHQGVIKLCDLGFAKTSNIDLLAKKGTTLGTPYYMSPEQCKGMEDVDIRSDIYSLGATLFHVLVGKVPFMGKSAAEILKKHIVEDLVIPQERRAALGEQVCHIIEKMMAKDRNDRYETPRHLLEELEPVMARFHAPKILIVYPARCFVANDLALLIAEGAYVEGIKVDLVTGQDVTAEQLIQAGAIIIGSNAFEKELPSDIWGVLDIMSRFPNDMRDKIGSVFVSCEDEAYRENSRSHIYTVFQIMINLGFTICGSFEGILGGLQPLTDPESPEAEQCRKLGNKIATTILNITAGKKTMLKDPSC